MRSTSPAFRSAIVQAHELAVTVELLSNGAVVRSLEVADGSITLDQTAASRGRCDVTLAGAADVVPTSPTDSLAPYGNELRISRGIAYPDETVEVVALGVFRLQDVDVDDSGTDLVVRVVGLDRSARIIDARFEEPYAVAAGVDYATAILSVIQSAWPGVPVGTWPSGATSNAPALLGEEGGDRWDFALKMAEAIGHDLYFDGDGLLCLVPSSSLSSGDPVLAVSEGTDGVLLSAGRHWTRQGAFNRVVASSSNTSLGVAPARGVATDSNPYSPTYYYGPFGKAPRFYSSPFLATDAQAQDAAAALLSRELGTSQSVSFGALVLPHLEPGDVVQITRQRAGLAAEQHVIDQLTIPLTAAGTMAGSTRAVQVTS